MLSTKSFSGDVNSQASQNTESAMVMNPMMKAAAVNCNCKHSWDVRLALTLSL